MPKRRPDFRTLQDPTIGNANAFLLSKARTIAGSDTGGHNRAVGILDNFFAMEQFEQDTLAASVNLELRNNVMKQRTSVLQDKEAQLRKDIHSCEANLKHAIRERDDQIQIARTDRRECARLDARIAQLHNLRAALGEYESELIQAIEVFSPFKNFIKKAADVYAMTPGKLVDRHLTLTKIKDENQIDMQDADNKLLIQRKRLMDVKTNCEEALMELNSIECELREKLTKLQNSNTIKELDIEKKLRVSSAKTKFQFRLKTAIKALYGKISDFRDLPIDESLNFIEMLDFIQKYYHRYYELSDLCFKKKSQAVHSSSLLLHKKVKIEGKSPKKSISRKVDNTEEFMKKMRWRVHSDQYHRRHGIDTSIFRLEKKVVQENDRLLETVKESMQENRKVTTGAADTTNRSKCLTLAHRIIISGKGVGMPSKVPMDRNNSHTTTKYPHISESDNRDHHASNKTIIGEPVCLKNNVDMKRKTKSDSTSGSRLLSQKFLDQNFLKLRTNPGYSRNSLPSNNISIETRSTRKTKGSERLPPLSCGKMSLSGQDNCRSERL